MQQRRAKIWLAMGAVVLLLAGMVAYNAWRPATTADDIVESTAALIVATDWEHATPEQRQALREQWEALPPETRQEIFLTVARQRIEELKIKLDGLPPEERATQLQEMTARMRQRHAQITPEEREQARQRLTSKEGREMVRRAIALYESEFTARERDLLDPLMREWLAQVERLGAGR